MSYPLLKREDVEADLDQAKEKLARIREIVDEWLSDGFGDEAPDAIREIRDVLNA